VDARCGVKERSTQKPTNPWAARLAVHTSPQAEDRNRGFVLASLRNGGGEVDRGRPRSGYCPSMQLPTTVAARTNGVADPRAGRFAHPLLAHIFRCQLGWAHGRNQHTK